MKKFFKRYNSLFILWLYTSIFVLLIFCNTVLIDYNNNKPISDSIKVLISSLIVYIPSIFIGIIIIIEMFRIIIYLFDED